MAVNDYRGAKVRSGDTLEIMGGFKNKVMKNGKNVSLYKPGLSKTGKKWQMVGTGFKLVKWHYPTPLRQAFFHVTL